ncbi:hypothetical protein KC350_g12 [Hortaea werneckii]|nr:hypothetical protein KC350_g12 [Hortaea werneckii]
MIQPSLPMRDLLEVIQLSSGEPDTQLQMIGLISSVAFGHSLSMHTFLSPSHRSVLRGKQSWVRGSSCHGQESPDSIRVMCRAAPCAIASGHCREANGCIPAIPSFLHSYSLTSHLIPIPGAASSLCRPQLLRHPSSCTLPTCSVVYGAGQPKYSLTASSRSGYYNVTYLVERGNSQSEEEDWYTPHNSATLTPS